MDIWSAFDRLDSFLELFTDWLFGSFMEFFTVESEGILVFWPFFVALAIFLVFVIIRALVNFISEL